MQEKKEMKKLIAFLKRLFKINHYYKTGDSNESKS